MTYDDSIPPSRRTPEWTYRLECPVIPCIGMDGYHVIDGWVGLGRIVPCSVCYSPLAWAEAGYVPGYRVCTGCGRGYILAPSIDWPERDGDPAVIYVTLTIPRVSDGQGERYEWEYPYDPRRVGSDWVTGGDGADLERAARYAE